MDSNWHIGSVTGVTTSDHARLHIGHHVEHHVYLDESQLSPAERRRLRQDAILSSLSFDGMTDRERAISDACEHTFHWAFGKKIRSEAHPDFGKQANPLPVWLSEGKGIFFVTGKAGSGKSTFLRYLAEHRLTQERLEKWAEANGSSLLVASHFFWCSGGKAQSSQEGLWRSILFLILKQHRELIPLMFSQRLEDDLLTLRHLREQSWGRRDLANALSQLPDHLRRHKLVMCLFIDGLDEFEGDESILVAEMKHLLASPLIKICASSRPRTLFESAFGGEDNQWKLMLHAHTRKDIARLVRSQLHGDQGFLSAVPSKEHRQGFIDKIEERADGVFLWAVLVVREIIREVGHGGTMDDLEVTLDMLPSELTGSEGLFQRIIERSDPKHRKNMARLLLLVLYGLERRLPPMYSRGAHFVFREWHGIDSIRRGCLQLNDKYREPWQHQIHEKDTEEPCCCGIFLECHTSKSGLHTDGRVCGRNIELLKEESKRQINRWCPDFVTADCRIEFSHRSIGDYLRLPEMQQNLITLAGEDFDPAPMYCYSLLAVSRLQDSPRKGQMIPASGEFLNAVLDLKRSHRDFARILLLEFERLHTAECTHSAQAMHGKLERTPANQAFQCFFDQNDRYELTGGGSISTGQQYHAWFLSLLAVKRFIWYVEEEWPRIPIGARQDVGSIILAALIVNIPAPFASTGQMTGLMKTLLSSGVSPNKTYTWSFRSPRLQNAGLQKAGEDHSQGEYDLSMGQVLVRMMPIIRPTDGCRITWILDTMEILLAFGCTDLECSLPGDHKSLFSAMKYDPVNYSELDTRWEREQQWRTYGPRLQSILATHRLLTRDERRLAKKGRLIESAVDNSLESGPEIPPASSRSTRKRVGDWILKMMS